MKTNEQHAADRKTIEAHRASDMEFPAFTWKKGQSFDHQEAEAIRALDPATAPKRKTGQTTMQSLNAIWAELEAVAG